MKVSQNAGTVLKIPTQSNIHKTRTRERWETTKAKASAHVCWPQADRLASQQRVGLQPEIPIVVVVLLLEMKSPLISLRNSIRPEARNWDCVTHEFSLMSAKLPKELPFSVQWISLRAAVKHLSTVPTNNDVQQLKCLMELKQMVRKNRMFFPFICALFPRCRKNAIYARPAWRCVMCFTSFCHGAKQQEKYRCHLSTWCHSWNISLVSSNWLFPGIQLFGSFFVLETRELPDTHKNKENQWDKFTRNEIRTMAWPKPFFQTHKQWGGTLETECVWMWKPELWSLTKFRPNCEISVVPKHVYMRGANENDTGLNPNNSHCGLIDATGQVELIWISGANPARRSAPAARLSPRVHNVLLLDDKPQQLPWDW